MTIKLVKVFGALAPLEPRLAKKLVEPLGRLVETTHAKSLLCVNKARRDERGALTAGVVGTSASGR